MTLTSESVVAEIATEAPATIHVFQQHQIDFCCGGKLPLAQACRARGLDVGAVLDDLRAALAPAPLEPNWNEASLTSLVRHIQERYHEPLRRELPRLEGMLQKVVSRHGAHLPEKMQPLEQTFGALQRDLLAHMANEDRVLFPFIVALDSGEPPAVPGVDTWIDSPIAVLEAEHADAGAALQAIREITDGFAPPDWACPTFRGLYHGLAQLESDMHVHVHLENNVLFPRAARLARRAPTA
jgi:regulator of cell morphogenesis and NO signaling